MSDKFDFTQVRLTAHVWYWVQLAIWPFIRSSGGCVYCIFLRGMLAGIFLSLIGGGVWQWMA